jgi:hypothetical protein
MHDFLRRTSFFGVCLAVKKTSTFIALVFVSLLSCSLVKPGQAGYINLGTYDATGLPRDLFSIGGDVRLIASSSDIPITITVTDPDGIVVHSETYDGYEYDKILSGLTENSGWFMVEASSPIDEVHINYASTYIHTFVGGKAIPINMATINSELQTPWIWLSTVILAISTSIAYIKHRKKQ